jgi:hypothetical protein
MPACLRQAESERKDDDEQQSADFRQRRDVLDSAGSSHTDIIECGRDDDRRCRDVVNVRGVRRNPGIIAQDPDEILGECRRDRAESRRANHHELRPPEQERGKAAPCLAYENVNAARPRIGACNLGQSQCSA